MASLLMTAVQARSLYICDILILCKESEQYMLINLLVKTI